LVPQEFYTYNFVFLPDLTQKYGLRIKGGVGEMRATENLVNGCLLYTSRLGILFNPFLKMTILEKMETRNLTCKFIYKKRRVASHDNLLRSTKIALHPRDQPAIWDSRWSLPLSGSTRTLLFARLCLTPCGTAMELRVKNKSPKM